MIDNLQSILGTMQIPNRLLGWNDQFQIPVLSNLFRIQNLLSTRAGGRGTTAGQILWVYKRSVESE